jgi:hypothetical protein
MTINSKGLLRPQVSHVKALVDSLYINGFATDASETGTGKMYCAAAVAREMNVPVYIICPKAVIPTWERIIKLFKLKPKCLVNFEKLTRGNTRWMKWVKNQPDPSSFKYNARCELPVFRFEAGSFVIVDEGHKCKGVNTSNAWMMIALKLQGYQVLVSSATIACTPLEMKAFGYLVNLHKLYNFNDFCRLHGAKWVGKWGAMTWNMVSKEATAAMQVLHDYLYKESKCASRMTVEMFGKLFPETHIIAEAFEMGANQKKLEAVYDEMEVELAKLEEKSANYKAHVFAVMMKARRFSELLKIPFFVDKADDLLEEGKSVVIFVNFDDTVQGLYKRLCKSKYVKPEEIGFIVGGQSAKVRQEDIDAFNADKKRLLIVNIAAGGTGISLHDLNGKFPRASLISPNWSSYNLRQALGRIWRQGGKTKSYQLIIYAAKTVEEQICRRVQAKLSCLDTLNDGDLAEHLILLK